MAGWNGSGMGSNSTPVKPKVTAKKPSPIRGLVAGAVLVAAVIGCYFAFFSGSGKPQKVVEQKKPTAIKEVKPAIAPKKEVVPEPVKEPDPELLPSKRIVEMITVRTNEDGSVLERFRTADGKLRSRQSAPKAIFECATDDLIAMAISGSSSGHAMPPMPTSNNADEEFRESLKKEIVINEDDPEKVKEIKLAVREGREVVKQLMAEGRTFNEIMANQQEFVNGNVKLREEALKAAQEMVDSGDSVGAAVYVSSANKILEKAGADPVEVPLTREERRKAIRQRHRQKGETK